MTICHPIISVLLAVSILAAGCSPKQQGPSLAEYALSPQAQKRQFQAWLSEQNRILYDPNSPYRDEEAYISVLEQVIGSPYADSLQKEQARRDLPLLRLNRIGKPAADFSFTLRNGRSRKLSSVKADYILLFFSNPGCADCKRITDILQEESVSAGMTASGRLKVVNIYPDDDMEKWFEYSASYPKEWLSGFSPDVDEPAADGLPLYNLRAIPSLYLLDRQHCTLLKDAPLERILSYLEEAEDR